MALLVLSDNDNMKPLSNYYFLKRMKKNRSVRTKCHSFAHGNNWYGNNRTVFVNFIQTFRMKNCIDKSQLFYSTVNMFIWLVSFCSFLHFQKDHPKNNMNCAQFTFVFEWVSKTNKVIANGIAFHYITTYGIDVGCCCYFSALFVIVNRCVIFSILNISR